MHNPFLALHRDGTHAGPPADRIPAPGLADRQPASADALAAPEELVSLLRRRVDQDGWHRANSPAEASKACARSPGRAGAPRTTRLNLAGVTNLIKDRETVNAETPLGRSRAGSSRTSRSSRWTWRTGCTPWAWACCVGWGPLRNGANVGPALPDADESPDQEGLPLRRRRHHRHQSVAELLHDQHRQESRRAANPRRSDADAPGSALARDGGQQVVHPGGRHRLDRDRQPWRTWRCSIGIASPSPTRTSSARGRC